MYIRKNILIIDGYNVLRSGSRYRGLYQDDFTDDAFNHAREMLLNDVVSYAGDNTHAYVVFDGGQNKYSDGTPTTIGGVDIVFSPAGSSADKVIEKLAREARNNNVEALVVTSDAAVQDATFGGGVERMSANGFSREIDAMYRNAKEATTPQISQKRTVEDRINSDTLAKLKALRDAL